MILRLVACFALGVAACAFVAVVRYAAMHPESEHPPLVPSVVFVAACATVGVARWWKSRRRA